jgi:photosystem II stability/assembly factor-like uncharacterized protein
MPVPVPRNRTPSVNTEDIIFAGTYGIGMFRSFNSGQSWEKINDGLLARYETCLAINITGGVTGGDIFVGADFVGGAGGVFRSTDQGDSWVEINHGVIQTDVRALAINSSGHIFAGTYPGSGVFRSTDNGDSWVPVNNGLDCGNIWSLAINPSGAIFAGTAACGTGIYRSTDEGESWTLVNTGLTSTDVAALAINDSNGTIFAGTHSIMGQGGGMFRSTDNGDTWTEQNHHFTAVDVNSVTINFLGHIFAGAAGGVFRSIIDGDSWTDVSSGLLPPGGNVWALAIDSETFLFAGTAGGGVFRSMEPTVTGRPIPVRPRPTPHPRPTP